MRITKDTQDLLVMTTENPFRRKLGYALVVGLFVLTITLWGAGAGDWAVFAALALVVQTILLLTRPDQTDLVLDAEYGTGVLQHTSWYGRRHRLHFSLGQLIEAQITSRASPGPDLNPIETHTLALALSTQPGPRPVCMVSLRDAHPLADRINGWLQAAPRQSPPARHLDMRPQQA